ncbi:hypothetical protein ACFQ7N_38285 [Streptomyces niveus]|uniref:hypothetical protein n=1 Tax=Streptomyces niveus TaxID=193462 RepID=UPI0036BF1791
MTRSAQSRARRARLRLVVAGVVTVAAIAAGGVLVVGAVDGADPPDQAKAKPSAAAPGNAAGPSASKPFTPATGPHVPLLKATTAAQGIGMGFEGSSLGALSAAVSYWQDLDVLDDAIARRQWSAIVSEDSPGTVDRGVSEVRALREGAGLPPSGGAPDGVTISTVVKAARAQSLDTTGDVVKVSMVYDRYAVVRDEGADDNPLRDEVTDLVVKWEGGDWKVSEEPRFTADRPGPRTYDPDSRFAFDDGWRMVARG